MTFKENYYFGTFGFRHVKSKARVEVSQAGLVDDMAGVVHSPSPGKGGYAKDIPRATCPRYVFCRPVRAWKLGNVILLHSF
jgi:hypothetical protein